MMHVGQRFLFSLAATALVTAVPHVSRAQTIQVPPEWQDALTRITPTGMESDLRFLSSDEMAGRATPSPELDQAARWIAGEFQRAGLKSVGDDGYFQTVQMARFTDARGRTRTTTRDRVPEGTDFEALSAYNVLGLIEGSDPTLKETYVILSAHYDHLGIRSGASPDSIFNGANDDGSGTVGVVAAARAIASLKTPPRRSILFALWCGEERGLVGSGYYGAHPVVPVARTVGLLNLEQIGRTDGDGGDQTGRASLTGYDYSSLSGYYHRAGLATGIDVFMDPVRSPAFFNRSDNAAMARLGVPAHALCVAFEYPDYHGADDEWDRVDYPNLAATTKMIALGTLMMADDTQAPMWNAANENTARYLEAWKKLHPPR